MVLLLLLISVLVAGVLFAYLTTSGKGQRSQHFSLPDADLDIRRAKKKSE